MLEFNAQIYKIGINAVVDIPKSVTDKLEPTKGYIWIRGAINNSPFSANLVPTKNGPYRLYVNMSMLKGGDTEKGKTAKFVIEQNPIKEAVDFLVPKMLINALKTDSLEQDFEDLTESRRKNILKYLHFLKTDASKARNIERLIGQLMRKEKDVRIP